MDNRNKEKKNKFPMEKIGHSSSNQSKYNIIKNNKEIINKREIFSPNDSSSENKDQNQSNSQNLSMNISEEKKNTKHLKRRSKSEVDGRNFICKMCNKSYLSYPALYTHYKLKHNTNNSSGRGRGRPKKEQNENEVEKSKYNPINITFFSKEERTGMTEKNEIDDCINIVYHELYSDEYKKRNELRKMIYYDSVEKHPFLGKFKEDEHDIYKNVINEHEISDRVLIGYLNKMSIFCNIQYYIKLIKFVTLFREHVNQFNKNKVDKNKYATQEYSEIYDAEDLPDSSNEFITNFLHPEGTETDFGFTKDESIDLIQNLCYWMYENNYTCSKLYLYDNGK